MNRLCFALSLRPAVVATILVTAATSAFAFSQGDLQAKLEYCETCHGISGQGYRGSIPIPRLAGQPTEYLENQLRAFIERRRENKFMFGVVSALNPAMLPALAAHFTELNPKPLKGASKDLVAIGKKLYEEGDPEANIQPCAMCHGPEAKGQGTSPRLAGQLHDYVAKTLLNWSKERCQDRAKAGPSLIMEPIANSLTPPQIAALAAYLNHLE
jgi:cytochrome c553